MSTHAPLFRALALVALVSAGAAAQDDPYERKGLTAAVGFGVSSAGISCAPQCATERQSGVAWSFRVGGHVAPEFALGLESTLYRGTVKDVTPAGKWSMSWLLLTGLWYPNSDDDFFLKLGLGVSVVRADVPFVTAGSLNLNTSDFGASFGIGKDYRVTDRLALTAFATMLVTPRSAAVVNSASSGAKLSGDLIHVGLAVTMP